MRNIRTMEKGIIMAIVCLWACALCSQDPKILNFKSLNVQDGLSSRIVYDVVQDEQGIMWFATADGLDRYDGYNFKHYDNSAFSTSKNAIHQLFPDSQQRIWLVQNSKDKEPSLFQDLCIYDPVLDSIVVASEVLPPQLAERLDEIEKIHYSKNKDFFFDLKNGKNWFLSADGSLNELYLPKEFKVRTVGDGFLVGTYFRQLLTLDLTGKPLHEPVDLNGKLNQLVIGQQSNYLLDISNGETFGRDYWLFDGTKLKSLNLIADQTNLLQRALVYNSALDEFWIVGEYHIYHLNAKGQVIQSLDDSQKNIIERRVNNLIYDKNRLIWMATNNGVIQLEAKPNRFEKYLFRDPEQSLGRDQIQCRGMLIDDDNLFVNTYEGRYRIDLRNGRQEKINIGLPDDRNYPLKRFPIIKDHQGNIWTASDRLISVDKKTGEEIKGFDLMDHEKAQDRIWSIFEAPSGLLWLGKRTDLFYFDPKKGGTIREFDKYNGFEALKDALILGFHLNDDGNIWICSNAGIFVLNEESGILAQYSNTSSTDAYIPSNDIQHLYQIGNVIWLATGDKGLIRWDLSSQQFQSFNKKNHFPSNTIYSVYPDQFGRLWMSSNFGIVSLDTTTLAVESYDPDDGISYYEFNRISHYQDEKGKLYFGSLNGVTAFDPARFTDDQNDNVDIIISNCQIKGDKKQNLLNYTSTVNNSNVLNLGPNEEIHSLEVSLLDYFEQQNIRYSYKIPGVIEEWRMIQGNSIPVEGITANEFVVEVKANKTGNSEYQNKIELKVTRTRPFWKSPIFYVLISLGIFLSVWLRSLWRNRQLKLNQLRLEEQVMERTKTIEADKKTIEEQAAALKEVDKMKNRFFVNITHELKTPLTLILAPVSRLIGKSELNHEEKEELKIVQQNARLLKTKIDEILTLTKLDSAQIPLEKKAIDLGKFLEKEVEPFVTAARSRKIDLTYANLLLEPLHVYLDVEKLKTILSNLLANALKFTSPGKGKIVLLLNRENDQFIIEVKDNGDGILEADLPRIFDRYTQSRRDKVHPDGGVGIGLALVKQLTELMQGTIDVQSLFGQGANFILKFKIEEAILKKDGAPIAISENEDPKAAALLADNTINNSSKIEILLVEDNISLIKYLKGLLKDYEVNAFENGALAWNHLNKSTRLPDLILSDIMMPVMDGYQLLDKIKTSDRFSGIPIIMLTARTDPKEKLRALRIGVDDYIFKPFESTELLASIEFLTSNLEERQQPEAASEESVQKEEEIKLNPNQQKWLAEVEELFLANMFKRNFTQDNLGGELHLSKRQLSRRIKSLTGLTTNNYLKEIRLASAKRFLEEGTYGTVSEVSYAVGFEDQHYFSKQYLKRFGRKPISYFKVES